MFTTYIASTIGIQCLYGKNADMTADLALEERIAHLTRAVDDLSEVMARQGHEIDRLTRLVGLLAEREAEREGSGGSGEAKLSPG